eukprot:PhM_4_TR13978/c3_g2_i2/m.35992
MAQLDAKSYFYQFPLREGARDVFGVALGNRRGKFEKYRLTVMPMGFKHAPSIAQTVSNALLENCASGAERAAWLDNFLFWGTKEEVRSTVASFKSLCSTARVELKPSEEEGTALQVLGMRVDTVTKTVTLAPKNKESLQNALHALKNTQTARTVFGVFGAALWALYAVARSPLCQHEAFIKIVARVAPDSRDGWDTPVCLRHDEWTVITMTVEAALASTWSPPRQPPQKSIAVWTDASSVSLAWVLEMGQREMWASQDVTGEDIFLRELVATARGVHAAYRLGATAISLGDNTAAVQACRRGYSRSPKANVVLRRLTNLCPAWFAWVPTTLQRADALTRGAERPGPLYTHMVLLRCIMVTASL